MMNIKYMKYIGVNILINLINNLNDFSIIIAPIFYKLLFMSITASFIGLIVIIIRKCVDSKISPKWKYTLWFLVLISLMVSYRPISNYSLTDEIAQIKNISFRQQYQELNKVDNNQNYTIQQKAEHNKIMYQTIIFDIALPLIWFIISVISIAYLFVSKLYIEHKVKLNKVETSDNTIIIFDECKKILGIETNIELITQSYLSSPAIIGIFKPKIILPDYYISDQSLMFVLLHELCHYKRKDMVINYIMLFLSAIYWFNPLVFILFKLIREDMEIVNDNYVLKYIDNKKGYTLSLVEILASTHNISFAPKILCMVDSKKNTKRRIKMINLKDYFNQNRIVIAIISITIIITTSMLFLTKATEYKTPPPIYVHTIDGDVYELEMGGYSWDYNGFITTDSIDYTQISYDKQSTDMLFNNLETNKNYFFSTSKDANNQKNPEFEIIEMHEYVDGQETKLNAFDTDYVEVNIKENEEIYYKFSIKYEQGVVDYSLFVDRYQDEDYVSKYSNDQGIFLDNYMSDLEIDELFKNVQYGSDYKKDGKKLEDFVENDFEFVAFSLFCDEMNEDYGEIESDNELESLDQSIYNGDQKFNSEIETFDFILNDITIMNIDDFKDKDEITMLTLDALVKRDSITNAAIVRIDYELEDNIGTKQHRYYMVYNTKSNNYHDNEYSIYSLFDFE